MFGFRRGARQGPARGRRQGIGAPAPVLRRAGELPDLERYATQSAAVPGMMHPKCAQFLYALCAQQLLPGDVAEVGSWQGYSTSFLARAVRDTGNGRLFAIDHFQGNPGHEAKYVVGRPDRTDLRASFEANLRGLGLWGHVTLLDLPNDQAARQLQQMTPPPKLRFLLIDGDHTRAGVQRDIDLFFPLLLPGATVVFDDFSTQCAGVAEAVDELLTTRQVQRRFAYRNTLVVVV